MTLLDDVVCNNGAKVQAVDVAIAGLEQIAGHFLLICGHAHTRGPQAFGGDFFALAYFAYQVDDLSTAITVLHLNEIGRPKEAQPPCGNEREQAEYRHEAGGHSTGAQPNPGAAAREPSA